MLLVVMGGGKKSVHCECQFLKYRHIRNGSNCLFITVCWPKEKNSVTNYRSHCWKKNTWIWRNYVHTLIYTCTEKLVYINFNQCRSTESNYFKWILQIYTIWIKASMLQGKECGSIYFIIEKFPREVKCPGQGYMEVKSRNHPTVYH